MVDPRGAGGGPATLRVAAETMARWSGAEHAVVVLGGARERGIAERSGLRVLDHVALPLGSAALGRSSFSRLARGLTASHGFGALLAWSARAAIAVAAASPAVARFAWLSVGATGSVEAALLRRAARCGHVSLMAAQQSVRNELAAIGIPRERVPLVAPGIAVPLVQRSPGGACGPAALDLSDERRAELRARWSAEPAERMVGLFADPPNAADVRLSCYAVAIARVAERPIRVVMHPAVHAGDRWRRWSLRTGLGTAMAVDAELEAPWSIAAGLDFAIVLGERRRARTAEQVGTPSTPDPLVGQGRRVRPMIGPLPALWLMACGVPVVAESTEALRSVVQDGKTGRLFPSQDHVRLAQRLTGLCDDPATTRGLADAARANVVASCSPDAFVAALDRALFSSAGR